jgi:hypothetical protein
MLPNVWQSSPLFIALLSVTDPSPNVPKDLLKRFEKIGRQTYPTRDIHIHLTTATVRRSSYYFVPVPFFHALTDILLMDLQDTHSTCSILARVGDLLTREQLREVSLLS